MIPNQEESNPTDNRPLSSQNLPNNTSQHLRNLDDYLLEGSEELDQYISILSDERKQANAKLACVKCWCKLAYYQRQQHISTHDEDIKRPTEFSTLEGYCKYALENGHFIEMNGKLYFQKLNEKPAACMQVKKLKLSSTENSDSEPGQPVQPVLVTLSKQMKEVTSVSNETPPSIQNTKKKVVTTNKVKNS